MEDDLKKIKNGRRPQKKWEKNKKSVLDSSQI